MFPSNHGAQLRRFGRHLCPDIVPFQSAEAVFRVDLDNRQRFRQCALLVKAFDGQVRMRYTFRSTVGSYAPLPCSQARCVDGSSGGSQNPSAYHFPDEFPHLYGSDLGFAW